MDKKFELFDPAPIAELRMMDSDGQAGIVTSIIEMFEKSVEDSIDKMEAHLRRGDAQSVGEIAHILKSSSGNIGAKEFSFTCERLEKLCVYERQSLHQGGLQLLLHLKEILPATLNILSQQKITKH